MTPAPPRQPGSIPGPVAEVIGRQRAIRDYTAEPVTDANLAALLDARSEHHWLRMCHGRLGYLFPYMLRQPGYHKRVKAAAQDNAVPGGTVPRRGPMSCGC